MVSPTYAWRLSQHALDLDAAGQHSGSGAWKEPCWAATTANITIATALNNGDTLDGLTLATGQRVLVKDQTAPEENGIYVVGASPARADDFDSEADILGAVVVVLRGSTNEDTAWLCTTDPTITVGSSPIAFAAFGGGGGGGTPTLEDVLLVGNDPGGTAIQAATGSQLTPARLLIGGDPADGSGANVELKSGGGTSGNDGGYIDIQAGGGDGGGNAAEVLLTEALGDGTGGSIELYAGYGRATTGAAGGDLRLEPGLGDGAGADGNLIVPNLPTADPTVTDAIWSDGGTLVQSGFTAGGGGGPTFVDSEVPTGTVDGVNAAFTLAGTPDAGSLHLYKNGLRQRVGSGNDYTLSGLTITYEAGNLPMTGDSHLADYRT